MNLAAILKSNTTSATPMNKMNKTSTMSNIAIISALKTLI